MARRKPYARRRGAKTMAGAASVLLIAACVLIVLFQPYMEQEPAALPASAGAGAEIYYFDVGQGDSALVRVGDYTLLIDAGEREAAETVAENLEALGVETLTAAVATHPHADHIGGMSDILEQFGAETFYMSVLPEAQTMTTRTYERLLDTLTDHAIPTKQLTAGMALPTPENTVIEVLSPRAHDTFGEVNDYSAVLRFTYGDVSFLFTGDAETPVEEILLEEGVALSASVLKCGHHGSSSSSSRAFLRAVQPQYAVISCDTDNSYGHPHRETVASLDAFGISALRTDVLGTVAAVTDGTGLSLYTWHAESGYSPLAE